MILMDCGNAALGSLLTILKNILNIIWIVGPILAIISLAINITMLVKDPDDKKIPKKIKNSILALIILFLVPTIVNVCMLMLGDSNSISSCWNNGGSISTNPTYIDPYDREKSSVYSGGSDYEKGVARTESDSSTINSSTASVTNCGNLEYCNRFLTSMYNNSVIFNDALVKNNSRVEFGSIKGVKSWDKIIARAERGELVKTTCSRPTNWGLNDIIGPHDLINSVNPGGFRHYSGAITQYTEQLKFDGSMSVKTAIKKGLIVPGDIIGCYKHTFTIYSVNQKKGSAMVFDGGHRFTNKCQQKRKCSILFEYTARTNSSLKLLQIIRWTK